MYAIQKMKIWTDKDGVLYHQEGKGRPRIIIQETLIETVLTYYHELPFTAHQGVHRTIGFISQKYWWKTMKQDVTAFIRKSNDRTDHPGIEPGN